MSASVQQHPDYHEGYQHGLTADLDNLRCGYETTPEYCAGYDAGHDARALIEKMMGDRRAHSQPAPRNKP